MEGKKPAKALDAVVPEAAGKKSVAPIPAATALTAGTANVNVSATNFAENATDSLKPTITGGTLGTSPDGD